MSTQASRSAARIMLSPAVLVLLAWMIVPLALTLWFSALAQLEVRSVSSW